MSQGNTREETFPPAAREIARPDKWAIADARLGANGFEPQTLSQLHQICELAIKGGYAPKGTTVEGAMLAIAKGREVGLPALYSLQNIAVINGKPSIYGDAMLALVKRSGLLEDHKEGLRQKNGGRSEDAWEAYSWAKRKGQASPVEAAFSVAEAKKAGLWGKPGPWQNYPRRMLQMRARSFCLRDAFPDVLGGMYAVEEAQDFEAPAGQLHDAMPDDSPVIQDPFTQTTPGESGDGPPTLKEKVLSQLE